MNGQGFLKGAIIISIGGIVAKIIGALYRIPLTNLLGGEGMGVYQMVYPLYCLLLTISATGIPSGLAREISSARARGDYMRERGVFLRSLTLFSLIGLIGVVLMLAIAPVMSTVQGEPKAKVSYAMLAPSVFFVSIISCFRGFFQGKSNFTPTALSEIIEQAVKFAVGLYFAYRYRDNALVAVSYALLAVTISEIVALAFMILYYFFENGDINKPLFKNFCQPVKNRAILKITMPVTLISAVLPFSNIIDSILIVNLLSRYTDNATSLYGIYSGGVNTIVNLPASVCYGLAAAVIPAVATLYGVGKFKDAEKRVTFALKCTMFVAIPSAAFLATFSEPCVRFVFRSLKENELQTMVSILRFSSFSAFLFPCVQTLSACLTGRGKPLVSAFVMIISVIVKIILEFILLRFKNISILGAAISQGACYLVALVFDLLYIIRDRKNLIKVLNAFLSMSWIASISVFAAFPFEKSGVMPVFFTCVGIYLILTLMTGVFTKEELKFFKRSKYDKHSGARS